MALFAFIVGFFAGMLFFYEPNWRCKFSPLHSNPTYSRPFSACLPVTSQLSKYLQSLCLNLRKFDKFDNCLVLDIVSRQIINYEECKMFFKKN